MSKPGASAMGAPLRGTAAAEEEEAEVGNVVDAALLLLLRLQSGKK